VHNQASWKRMLPVFLRWAYGRPRQKPLKETAGGRCFSTGDSEQEHRPPAGSYMQMTDLELTSAR
jgi:hypothetical protein